MSGSRFLKRLPVALLGVVLGATLLVAACGDSDEPTAENEPTIVVAAAADLRLAFEELAPLFEAECGCQVELSFGSSGNFASQIEEGLPADVFFSADTAFVDRLEAKGLTLEGAKQLYAVGRVVLAKNAALGVDVSTPPDLLQPEIRRVAIANPQHAPYGVAAQEVLRNAGVWDAIQPRLVFGENASQATQFVESGDAQAGILPLSLAIRLKDELAYVLIDESQHTRLNQGAAVLKRSPHPELAAAFIDFVVGESGRAVMAAYGFLPPVSSRTSP